MASELLAVKTPVTKEQAIEALWKAWQGFFGSTPKKESIWVLASQWSLETGHGRSMWGYNLGNVKSREGDGYDYQFFTCNEILVKSQAEKLAAEDPEHAKISSTRADGTCIIWFYPKHPACRFRAFKSLLEGATDYIALLARRFDKAWPAVSAGDPAAFSHLLRVQRYYTADEQAYTSQLVSIFKSYAKLAFDYDSLPMLTTQEKAELDGVLAKSLADLGLDF
jgi:hypothetical protein